ncbi:6-hydroxypseudooxynicotine dehydrogenase complex subunit alpha [Baekduia alba]|uniref:FAD binding domain-containing protein n=1 Tax=Baekduia alba TaxID=2997333 RepID=UPI0023408207|nr:xanthine dehydrogenase family protein subunit M [Baekduia alba]WCB94920.1 6-hydroxypseudooxynicotine dehydrogenase complex subunit alpha [Baekduia alba]
MKPAPFQYSRADSVESILARLSELGYEAKLLAGGQSLVPAMNLRLARPSFLIDITHVDALRGIDAGTAITIGATTRQAEVYRSAEVRSAVPMLAKALRFVGHPATRSQGTVGGSVAHADPAAELPTVLLALGATCDIAGPRGARSVTADEFFRTYFTTDVGDDELLTGVRIPRSGPNTRQTFREAARRHGDFALIGVAASIDFDDADVVRSARIALCGVADRPVRATEAERSLEGAALTEDAIREAAALATTDLSPPSDVHASGAYRRRIAEQYVRRALGDCHARGAQHA